jgi:L-seryl-tRNA(Ser) seleniumtransferase
VNRDHEKEWAQYLERLNHIAQRVSRIPGVTSSVREPSGRSNRSPSLSIRWEAAKLGINGQEVSEILDTTEPRIALGGGGARRATDAESGDTGISITAFMMMPGDEKIVAGRVVEILSTRRQVKPPDSMQPPVANLTGRWDVEIQFAASQATHVVHLTQTDHRLAGAHRGDFIERDLNGSINGDVVRFSSVQTERHGDSLSYRFSGKVSADTMSGELDMGEYLEATWTARRRDYGRA